MPALAEGQTVGKVGGGKANQAHQEFSFLAVQRRGYNMLIKFALQIWNFLLAGCVWKKG